jgi:hypothetical protein
MTIDAYLEAVKERFVTDPLVTRFHVMRERSTLVDGYLRARLALADGKRVEVRASGESSRISPSHGLTSPTIIWIAKMELLRMAGGMRAA